MLGNRWYLKEEPLPSFVPERVFAQLYLHDIVWMADNARNFCSSSSTNLAPQSLEQVKATSDQLPSPAKVANTVRPVIVSSEWRNGLRGISDETANRVGIEGKEEGDKKMVSVPESFERLLADPGVSCRIHQQHTEYHDMSSDATSLSVVDLHSSDWPNLGLFNIVKVDVMSRSMDDAEKK